MSHKRGTSFFMSIVENYLKIKSEIPNKITVVAVSKTHSADSIKVLYDAGCRDFGENKVQELLEKQKLLPPDIRWHFIGHLQTNKVKQITKNIYLIHSVDSLKVLSEINKEANKCGRTIGCLLQFHIATEDTKFGFSIEDFTSLDFCNQIKSFKNIMIMGIMGMASFTDNEMLIRKEFKQLQTLFTTLKQTIFFNSNDFNTLSMGMSGDYELAINEGSTMVRIGTTIFGHREYPNKPTR